MKKIALTSLLTVFAVSGAHAANVIDGNPLYMPKANHFYSVTTLGSHSENESFWTLGEQFGYGISNQLALEVSTSATEGHEFDYNAWDDLSVKATFRFLNKGGLMADVYGAYGLDSMKVAGVAFGGVWPDHKPFIDEDYTAYTWTAGLRAGWTNSVFTFAGHAAFNYSNSESFNWTDKGMHTLALGLDAQFVINNSLNLVASAEYTGVLNKKWAYDDREGVDVKNAGKWHGEFGVNYNIDSTKFVGAYISGDMNHRGGTNRDEWKTEDGFGFGAKFGIDF